MARTEIFEWTAKFNLNTALCFYRDRQLEVKMPLFPSAPSARFRRHGWPPGRHDATVRVWQMPVERKPLANDRSPVYIFFFS